MGRRRTVVIIGLALAAVSHLVGGPGKVEGRVAAETGGRYQGSRIAASPGAFGAHTCVVKEDGTVRCWGSNDAGQLGNNSGGPGQFETTPVKVSNLSDAVSVAAGSSHTCAVRAGGGVSCWGANGSGQLGNGTTNPQSTPVSVVNPDGTALVGVTGITAGRFHTCATRVDGTARCWGSNGGRLGTGSTSPSSSPFAVTVTNLSDAVSVSAGDRHTCATRVNGGVRCWGSNHFGQLGIGTADDGAHATPADVRSADGSALNEVVLAAGGGFHTCVLRTNGQVRCWGNNDFGQVTGDGTATESRPSPTTVSGIGGAVVLALGTFHSCARRADGDIRCWGRNTNGQLGNLSTTTNPPDPATVVDRRVCNLTSCTFFPLLSADGLAAGERHACSLQVDEKVRCWGDNGLGQLGTGNTNQPLTSAALVSDSGGAMAARSIVAGLDQTCARRADGTVACWGSDLVPAAVAGFTRTLAVATGASHKCALGSDGLVRCVGSNRRGQIGNGAGGPVASDVTDPAQGLVSGLTDVVAIAAGHSFTCALRVTGTVRCWGANAFGQLGNDAGGFQGFGAFEPAPVAVQSLTDVVAIAAGREHACAVRVDGHVFCWGFNGFNQVGASDAVGAVVDSPFEVTALSGVSVAPISKAVAVTAGPDHSCALLVTGRAQCWGKNDVGQLGNGDAGFDAFFGADSTFVAFDVENLTDAAAVGAGGNTGLVETAGTVPVLSHDFSCGRRVGGSVTCWGDNAFGQLGDNSTTDRLQPQTSVLRRVVINTCFPSICSTSLLIGLGGSTAITTGDRFGCALVASGQPFCWGSGRTTAVGVSSFALNIDPSVPLIGNGRVARVSILANCPEGQQVAVTARVTQGNVSGAGIAIGACTGAIERYEATVPASERTGFAPGPAVVEAEAVIRDRGQVFDVQEWTRKVELAVR
jgi:alpha-tubulin suppressor-like RCC1 family protein